jgi:hypothetical protein
MKESSLKVLKILEDYKPERAFGYLEIWGKRKNHPDSYMAIVNELQVECEVCGDMVFDWVTLYMETCKCVCSRACLRKKLIKEGARVK